MYRPDLIVREITNGIQFWLFVCMSVCLIAYIWRYKLTKRESWNVFTFIPVGLVLLFLSLAPMRGWIWALLWSFNHDMGRTFQDDYRIAITLTGLAVIVASALVRMLTPRWPGQTAISRNWPWMFTASASVGIPVTAYFVGFYI